MGNNYLSPKSNVIFNKLFGDENHLDITASFIRSILDTPELDLSGLAIVSDNLNQDYSEANITLKTSKGVIINVNMLLLDKFDTKEAITCRMSKLLCEQTNSNSKYYMPKPVISVVITDFDFVKDSGSYRHTFCLYDEKNESLFSNLVTVSTIELSKLSIDAYEDGAWVWAHFFTMNEKRDFEILAAENEEIGKAVSVLAELSQDEEIRLAYRREEKARLNYVSEYVATKKDVARRMKEHGMGIDQIMLYTKLTEDEINNL